MSMNLENKIDVRTEECGRQEAIKQLSNEKLAAKIQAGKNVKANMLLLWQQNKGFIHKMAVKYTYGAELEDLKQEGYIGLCEAVKHYDPEQGVPFINYAAFWIKQCMQRYIENCGSTVRIPSHAHEWIYKYKKVISEYRKCYGVEPSDKVLCTLLYVNLEKLQVIKKSVYMGQIRSLNEPIAGEDEELTLEDTVSSDNDMDEDIIRHNDHQAMKRWLWEAVDNLAGNQATVIRCRFLDDKTMKEIGQQYCISGEAVRHQQDKAMRELRKPSKNRKFKGYYEEYIQAASFQHVGVRRFNETWWSEVEREAMRM